MEKMQMTHAFVRALATRRLTATTYSSRKIRCGAPTRQAMSTQTPWTSSLSSSFQQTRRIQRQTRYTTIHSATTTRLLSFSSSSATTDDNHHATVKQVLDCAIQALQDAHIDEAEDSVFHILAKVLDLSWESGFRELRQIYHHRDPSGSSSNSNNHKDDTLGTRRLTAAEQVRLDSFLERRKAHEPIQYLMGQWDFLDHVFAVVPPLLCPRPETEELVLYAASGIIVGEQQQQQNDDNPVRILDVGAGTGCIGISLASRVPNSIVRALDVEPQAVQTTRENARRILGPTAHDRYQVHLVAAQDFQIDSNRFDLVVSNPPYIPARDMETLDAVVSQWESHQALCGGEDGMDVIRTIVERLPYWCRSGAECWMEVDPTHPALLQTWLEQQQDDVGVTFVESRPDLFGLDRFVRLRVTKEKV